MLIFSEDTIACRTDYHWRKGSRVTTTNWKRSPAIFAEEFSNKAQNRSVWKPTGMANIRQLFSLGWYYGKDKINRRNSQGFSNPHQTSCFCSVWSSSATFLVTFHLGSRRTFAASTQGLWIWNRKYYLQFVDWSLQGLWFWLFSGKLMIWGLIMLASAGF